MFSNELVLLWMQIDTLHKAVAELIEAQRVALVLSRSSESTSGAQKLPEASEALLTHLNELQDRLQPYAQEAFSHVSSTSVQEKLSFEEIDVERVNIVEPDKTPRLILSNQAKAPDPLMDGKVFTRQGGNQAGIIFYNEEGNECGGL